MFFFLVYFVSASLFLFVFLTAVRQKEQKQHYFKSVLGVFFFFFIVDFRSSFFVFYLSFYVLNVFVAVSSRSFHSAIASVAESPSLTSLGSDNLVFLKHLKLAAILFVSVCLGSSVTTA